jgi:type I restriction enzyme S subunit
MGDVAEVVGGGTPKASNPSNFSDYGHPWITPADLSEFKEMYIRLGSRSLSDQGLRTSSAKLLPPGTVLMSSRAPIGYLAIAATEVSTNQGFKSFICKEGVRPEYVYYWLKFATPLIEEMGSGSTFTEVSGSRCREIPFLLAPTNEQKRIAKKVRELLARVDAARERLARVPAILKRFRQSVLAAACSGQLTAECREDNDATPAVHLLRALGARARAVLGKKYHEPACPEAEEEFDLPSGWAFVGIDSLLSIERSGMKTGPFGTALKKSEHQADGVPVLGIENIGPMRFEPGSKIHITSEKAAELAKYDAQPGDILISRSGTVGEVCVVPTGLGEARISTNIMRVCLAKDGMLPQLFCFIFNGSPFVLSQVARLCGGSTRDFLNQTILRLIRFPLPPLDEQREIVRRVDALFALANGIEAHVRAATVRADRLAQAILARAFRGELVPTEAELAHAKGRPYEPASALLTRIRQEKDSTGVIGHSTTVS